MRLTDGATCTEGAAVAKAGKAIMDGEIGDCDLIEVDSGSMTFVSGKLVVNEVEGVLRSQPPAHAQVDRCVSSLSNLVASRSQREGGAMMGASDDKYRVRAEMYAFRCRLLCISLTACAEPTALNAAGLGGS